MHEYASVPAMGPASASRSLVYPPRMKLRTVLVWLVAAFAVEALGCAVAADLDDGVPMKARRDGGADAGDDETLAEDTGDEPGDDTGSDEDASTPDDTGAADTGSGDDTGGSDGGPTDSGTPCTVIGTTDCSTVAENLGSTSGDKSGAAKTTSGTDNRFVRITVSEDDSGIFSPKDLKVRITLQSPPGQNFDLYAYAGKAKDDGGGVNCSSVTSSSTNASGDDVVALKWNDEQGITGHDDTKIISIEVRSADPICGGGTWTLTVEGNK